MDWEAFEKHKAFAGAAKPSMLRRRVGHDYQSRHIYLITMTIAGRRPLLGRLVGDCHAPQGAENEPHIELTELGLRVRSCWMAIEQHYPAIKVLATQVMPDHLHGILFVQEQMDVHLSQAIKGFKTGCNKVYREMCINAAILSQQRETNNGENNSGESSCSAATVSQQRKTQQEQTQERQTSNGQTQERQTGKGQTQERETSDGQAVEGNGLLWSHGYNDHILEDKNELGRWFRYLRDNPRRLAMRRAYAEYFRVRFDVTFAGQTYAAIGNRFLLTYPSRIQVRLSRRLTDEEIGQQVSYYLSLARKGAVLVSPAISKGEKAVMRAALNAKLPLIFITPYGFNDFSHPGRQFYDACSAGQLLLLAPWPHQNRKVKLTRDMCIRLNLMATSLACQ